MRAYLLAACAVLPLLAPEVWTGFRFGVSDVALAVIAPTEAPLSVRSPGGLWAIALSVTWFGLAYRLRDVKLWEVALVIVGGAAALLRLGNLWVDALAMLLPLARQLAALKPAVSIQLAAALGALVVAVATTLTVKPPELPAAASQVALATTTRGKDMADWRWAGELQRGLGGQHQVWAAGGLSSESFDFWLDYLRVAQGHERWAQVLRQFDVDLVVLEATDQQHRAAELVRASADWRVTFDAGGALVAERARP
jgi:hypothetical protein